MIRTIIIDDEAEAREGLKNLLGKDDDIDLVGECKNGLEAIQHINALKPELVFLDIQMPKINGFEVLNSLVEERLPQIVFVTAYDQYALQAFDMHAIDYLLKPFSDERFFDCLNHVKRHFEQTNQQPENELQALIKSYLGQMKDKENGELIPENGSALAKRLVIKSGGKIHIVNYKDIIRVEAQDYYIKVHTANQSFLMRESMKGMAQKLPDLQFVRIHKSHIVNLAYVTELEPYFNGEYMVKLQNGQSLKMSRTYRENLLGKLDV